MNEVKIIKNNSDYKFIIKDKCMLGDFQTR